MPSRDFFTSEDFGDFEPFPCFGGDNCDGVASGTMLKNLGRAAWIALACLGLGFLLIALAWYGASGVDCVSCQVPYVLSGGAAGIGLIALGIGLLIFEAGRRGRAHIEGKLDTLIDVLRAGQVTPTERTAQDTGKRGGPALTVTNGMVVIGRSSFHKPNCRLVEGKDHVDYSSPDEAIALGLNPCRVCDPTSLTHQPR